MPAYNEFIMVPYPKTCTILQYSGDLEWEGSYKIPIREVYLWYNFMPPKTVTVNEEYLIYDIDGFIGAVGGTMGIFIGFSFSNTFSLFMNFLVYIKYKIFD